MILLDRRGRLGPRHLRHAHVHDDNIRNETVDLDYGLATVRALTDDLDVLLKIQELSEAASDVHVVVDDEDTQVCFPSLEQARSQEAVAVDTLSTPTAGDLIENPTYHPI